ncbi:hypothetical protein [Brevibacillus sp. NRS-1366]|uniref:hypothetical protein n=1 Tax=Brevibacillus sp. NRS-1366 TaxID=3233899 RepID=UPI003D1ACD98
MKFYAIANRDVCDNYYDFELNTWGDGLCSNNLLPSESVALDMIGLYQMYDGEVIQVYVVDVTREDEDVSLEDESNETVGYISQYIWDDEVPEWGDVQ